MLVRKFASKPSRDEMIPRDQSKRDKIESDKDKSVREKSVRNANVDKVMRINNAFPTNILMFCDKESENKSLELSHFERSKDIRSSSIFSFLNAHFNVWFVKYYTTRFRITIVKRTNIAFKN